MELRTAIKVKTSGLDIGYDSKGLLAGSCFADNIGNRMLSALLPVTVNPTGIVFNPASIAASLNLLDEGYFFTESDLVRNDDLWVSFMHHGSFSSTDRDEALVKMNAAASAGAQALSEAEYVILTLGTSYIYERGGKVVANCHKFPAPEFRRRMMTVDEITGIFAPMLESFLREKKIIFTVSPVRHLSDGLEENSVSKATLLLAVNELCGEYGNCHYFPAYEIMMDDLRDYRFYERDMVHPSQLAIDYIWERFCEYALTGEARGAMKRIADIQAAAAHRPVNPRSEAHRKFLSKMQSAIEQLQKELPFADLGRLHKYFSNEPSDEA